MQNTELRILFICDSNSPYRLYCGGGQRSYFICKTLSQIGSVDILEITPKESELNKIDLNLKHLGRLQPQQSLTHKKNFISKISNLLLSILKKDYYFPIDNQIKEHVEKLIEKNKYDIIFCRYLHTATLSGLLKKNNVLIDLDDNPVTAFKIRNKNRKLKFLNYFIHKNINNFLKTSVSKNTTFLSNQKNITYKNQKYLPNIPYTSNLCTKSIEVNKNSILFIGTLAYPPNYEALDYFISNVWTELKKENPELVFYIIGKDLPEKYYQKFSNYKDILIKGYVEDITPYLLNSSVYISPIQQGAGTNIKILEAINYGLPIVASPESVLGFKEMLIDGYNIMIARNKVEYLNKITQLFNHPDLQKEISQNALKSLKSFNFTFENFSSIIQKEVYRILKAISLKNNLK